MKPESIASDTSPSRVRKRKWIFVSAVIALVPTLLFVGLFFQQPSNPTTTTTTCQTIKFEFERPSYIIALRELVGNTYTDDEGTTITLGLFLNHYIEHSVYEGSDNIAMNVSVSARVPNGSVESVNVTFWEDYQNSLLMFHEVQSWPKYWSKAENLSIRDYAHFLQTSGLKAFMELVGINRPKSVYFTGILHWLLRSPQNETHQMEVTVELTYFNGTGYEKAVLPIEIVVWADAGDSFETARVIVAGDYRSFIGNAYGTLNDPEDLYRIWVENGQTIEVRVSPFRPSLGIDFDLYLYNPDLELVANTTEEEIEFDVPEEISYTAETSGYWYIRVVNAYLAYGWYQLSTRINGK